MENVSRFSTNFAGKVVTSGSKTGSAYPQLTVTSTKDQFVLNPKALALLGLSEGGYVAMIDVNKAEAATTDHNARYYLTPGWDKGKGVMEGAKIGKGGKFSYATIYSAIMMDNPEISQASNKDLEAAGKGIIRVTPGGKETFIATQKVTFKVERLVEPGQNGEPDVTEFQVADGVFQKVYALTGYEATAHDPKEMGNDEAAE